MQDEPCNKIEDLAWAAGFIDADGTITIRRSAQSRPELGHPSINIQHQALVQVGQRDYPLNRIALNKLHEMFGGYSSWYKHNLPNRNNVIVWGVASQKAIYCLEQIYPYLVLKKQNADIVLKFHKEKIYAQGGNSLKRKLPKEELERREQCWQQIRELNKKGILKIKT